MAKGDERPFDKSRSLSFEAISALCRLTRKLYVPIEMRYVPIIAVEASESTALKATVLPMLIRETKKTNPVVAMIAFAGTWNRGLT